MVPEIRCMTDRRTDKKWMDGRTEGSDIQRWVSHLKIPTDLNIHSHPKYTLTINPLFED